MLRTLLEKNIKTAIKGEKKIAINFSGGTDSSCILFSCLSMGIKPVLYTYVVRGVKSEDLKRAEFVSAKYKLELYISTIPIYIEDIISDVENLIKLGINGKVAIQCMHGHIKIAPKVLEKIILNGSGIDGIYGVYKTFAFDGSRKNKIKFDKAREKHLNNPNDDSMIYQKTYYEKYNVRVEFPYRQSNILNYLMGKSWDEINRPRYKYIIVKEYPEFREILKYFRPRGSQQIVAGTRDIHNKLLTSRVNKKSRKRVNEIYKDMEFNNA